MIKKQPFVIFLHKKQRIYDYIYEFASEALHIVIFENFVKSMAPSLSELKVTPSFCFAFKIPDDHAVTSIDIFRFFSFGASKILQIYEFMNGPRAAEAATTIVTKEFLPP